MTTAVCFERRGHRVVNAYYARRLAEEMAALGYFVTSQEPESRKQQRNGDMYCSARRRQRAYYRRTRGGRAAT